MNIFTKLYNQILSEKHAAYAISSRPDVIRHELQKFFDIAKKPVKSSYGGTTICFTDKNPLREGEENVVIAVLDMLTKFYNQAEAGLLDYVKKPNPKTLKVLISALDSKWQSFVAPKKNMELRQPSKLYILDVLRNADENNGELKIDVTVSKNAAGCPVYPMHLLANYIIMKAVRDINLNGPRIPEAVVAKFIEDNLNPESRKQIHNDVQNWLGSTVTTDNPLDIDTTVENPLKPEQKTDLTKVTANPVQTATSKYSQVK